jgi:predicted amidohydrolase YtcJ
MAKSEILLLNANIITLASPGNRAKAVLIRDGVVAAVGEERDLLAMTGGETETVNLAGRTVVPGFNDDHLHVVGMGNHSSMVNLAGLSKREIVELLAERYPEPRGREPIVGVQWDYTHCPDPHAADLDRIFDSTPVFLIQYSGHAVWTNSAGLKLVGIDESTKDWPSGGAVRDSSGHLTGILREPYGHPGFQKINRRRQLDRAAMRRAVPNAFDILRRNGFTSVQDNTWFPATLHIYKALAETGGVTCRVSCWSLGALPLPLRYLFEHERLDGDLLRHGPRKYFLDGAFSSRTAFLTEPYADEADTVGKGKSVAEMVRMMSGPARDGVQIACHSIGDQATMNFCEALSIVSKRYPQVRARRFRIEHGQLIRREDIERIRDLGAVVSAQPHALVDPEKDRRLLGSERALRAYPYRSLLDAGAHLAFGSDFPGEGSFNPLLGMHFAVNREGAEAIEPEEALACYTRGSAYAEFEEERKGTIQPGRFADLTVLSEDPTRVRRDRIRDIEIEMTIVGGKIVYDRAAGAGSEEPGRSAELSESVDT